MKLLAFLFVPILKANAAVAVSFFYALIIEYMANYCWAKNKPTVCPLLWLTTYIVSLPLIIFPIKIKYKCSLLRETLSSVFQEMRNLE